MLRKWMAVLLLIHCGIEASPPTQRPAYRSWMFGAKATYPQLLALSCTNLSVEDPELRFKPFFQLEPGIFGVKVSGGLGSVAGFPIMGSVRIKAAYLKTWAGPSDWRKFGYGWMGPEIEVMTILPSAHLGLYHPIGEPAGIENLRPSFGIGAGF